MIRNYKTYMLNESLLDDVEVDEVEDNEDDRQRTLEIVFNITVYFRSETIAESINEMFCLFKKRGYILNYYIEESGYKEMMTVTFDVDENDFDINLFNNIFLYTKRCLDKKYAIDDIIDVVKFGDIIDVNDSVEPNSLYYYKKSFYNFNSYYKMFPGCTEKDILKSIIDIEIRLGIDKCVDKKNGLYALIINRTTPEKENMSNIFIVRRDGTLIYEYEVDLKKQYDNSDFHCGCRKVSIIGKGINYVNVNGELISDKFFYNGGDFDEIYGRAFVKNEKYEIAIINTSGKILSEYYKEFDFFNEGYAVVKKYIDGVKLSNYVDKDGNLLFKDQWFNECSRFSEDGLAEIKYYENDNFKHIFIDKTGKILFNAESFDKIRYASNGLFSVLKDKKVNFVDCSGKTILKRWYDDVDYFVNGFAIVKDDDKGCTYVDMNGEYVCKDDNGMTVWFDNCSYFDNEGNAQVIKYIINERYTNFIDTSGKTITDKWYESRYDIWYSKGSTFQDGFAPIYTRIEDLEGNYTWKCNFIGRDGKELLDEWYDKASNFKNGYAIVENYIDSKKIVTVKYVVNTEGKVLCSSRYKTIEAFLDGFAKVQNSNGRWNYMKPDGNVISKEWFSELGAFYGNGVAIVKNHLDRKMSKKINFINKDGNLIFSQWEYEENVDVKEKYDLCIIKYKYNKKTEMILPDGSVRSFDEYVEFDEDKDCYRIGYDMFIDKNGELVSFV